MSSGPARSLQSGFSRGCCAVCPSCPSPFKLLSPQEDADDAFLRSMACPMRSQSDRSSGAGQIHFRCKAAEFHHRALLVMESEKPPVRVIVRRGSEVGGRKNLAMVLEPVLDLAVEDVDDEVLFLVCGKARNQVSKVS